MLYLFQRCRLHYTKGPPSISVAAQKVALFCVVLRPATLIFIGAEIFFFCSISALLVVKKAKTLLKSSLTQCIRHFLVPCARSISTISNLCANR
jgi:hypothetical protein